MRSAIDTKVSAFVTLCSFMALSGCSGNEIRAAKECGRIIQHAEIDSVIYVFCPTLVQMSPDEIVETIDRVFADVGGIDRETIIYFFADDAIVAPPGGWPADYMRRVESWGSALVGWYYSHGNTATIRDKATGGWREVDLPLPAMPSSIAFAPHQKCLN